MLRAEAVDEQILEIAERDSAIDRPPRGEGDDQRVGAAGGSLGALGRILDPRERGFRGSAIRGVGRLRGVRLRERLRRGQHDWAWAPALAAPAGATPRKRAAGW